MGSKWKRLVAPALALGVTACAHQGTVVQSPAGAPPPVVVTGSRIPPGTQLVAQLDQPIGKDTRPGTMFTAHVAQPVLDAAGAPIIPDGSVVMGRVADVKSGGRNRPAEVDLVVDRLLVRGVEHPLDARIVATDVEAPKHGIKGSYVGIGAGGGGVLGAIIGGWQGAVIGGIAGAVAGTAVSLGLSGREANLPQGTALAIRLERPIPVAALRGPRPAMRTP